MAAVHTEAVAIFNGQVINVAENRIQYINYRPSQPFDGNTPINFTIPENSSQYISLRESYMFVQCHVEETDQFGNPITTSNTPSTPACSKRNVAEEFKMDDKEDDRYEMGEGDEEGEEEDMEQEEEDKSKATRAVPSNIPPHPFPASAQDVEEYEVEAECKYIKWQRVWTSFKKETNLQEKAKKKSFGRKSRRYGFIKYVSISFSKTHEKKRKILSKYINTH